MLGAVRLPRGPEKHQVAEEDAEEQGGGPRLRVQQEESGEENSAKDKSNLSCGPGFLFVKTDHRSPEICWWNDCMLFLYLYYILC